MAGQFNKVSILQLSTRQEAFLWDMRALPAQHVADAFQRVMTAPVLKIGLGFANDLKNIVKSETLWLGGKTLI